MEESPLAPLIKGVKSLRARLVGFFYVVHICETVFFDSCAAEKGLKSNFDGLEG